MSDDPTGARHPGSGRGHVRWPSRRCSSSSDGFRLRPISPLRQMSTTLRSTNGPRLTRGLLGRGSGKARLVSPLGHRPRVGSALRQVVQRRSAQCLRRTASIATSMPGAATRSPTTGKASPETARSSPTTISRRSTEPPTRCRELGVRRGDRVAIYMPMIPELPVAMLACARIGAPHTVVFGGFSAEALADRINDSQAKLVITADGGYRRGKAGGLKVNVDEAVQQTPSIEHVLVVQRTGQDVTMMDGPRPVVARRRTAPAEWCEPERMESEDMLYLLYTSGHDGQAEGHPAHDRRLSDRRHQHAPQRLRHQGRRRLLGGRRHRLGDRPLLHRLRRRWRTTPPG